MEKLPRNSGKGRLEREHVHEKRAESQSKARARKRNGKTLGERLKAYVITTDNFGLIIQQIPVEWDDVKAAIDRAKLIHWPIPSDAKVDYVDTPTPHTSANKTKKITTEEKALEWLKSVDQTTAMQFLADVQSTYDYNWKPLKPDSI